MALSRSRLVWTAPAETLLTNENQSRKAQTSFYSRLETSSPPFMSNLAYRELFRAHVIKSTPRSRAVLYRSYLQHLRLIPDPHVWNILVPPFRRLCEDPYAGPNDVRDTEDKESGIDSKTASGSKGAQLEWTEERRAEGLRESRRKRSFKKLEKVSLARIWASK